MADRIPGRVLVFTYRRINRFFHALAERTFEGAKTYCSPWPGLEPVNLQNSFYRHYDGPRASPQLSDHDYEQIIRRSCVLRLLPWEQSVRMVNAMYGAIDEVAQEARPDFLLTVSVDNYMTDILHRICRKRNARPLMLVAGSMSNTITMTSRGEFNHVREPGSEEIDAALALLLRDDFRVTYGTDFTGYSFWTHLRTFATWWTKCIAFKVMGWTLRDPLNFRFLMGSLPQRDGQSSIWGYQCQRYFDRDWERQLSECRRTPLFIPLAYTPEASVSYWLGDLRYIDYEDFILKTCETLKDHYQIVLKEHWSALGMRRIPFYQKLKSIPGTIVVPAEVNSRQVMSRVARLLVGAGTAGVEGAVRGLRVATLDKPYYFHSDYFVNIGSADRVKDLPRLLEEFPLPPNTREHQLNIVRRLLQTTFVGHMLPGSKIDTEENYRVSSEGLKRFLSHSVPTAVAP
jgi:hypothetical protein